MGVARFMGKHIGSMFEKGERGLDNLFTGVQLSGHGKKVATTALGMYAGYQVLNGAYRYHYDSAMTYNRDDRGVQSLPGTQGDGLGYQMPQYSMQNSTNSPKLDMDLGAGGDLVFALHNLRHGG
jgi:hypothetical protein